jgi:putative hydrolase
MRQFQQAMQAASRGEGPLAANLEGGVNWNLAAEQAKQIAHDSTKPVEAKFRDDLKAALHVGTLWLNEATAISEITAEPKLLSRELWVADALPLFKALSEPVAGRMAEALTENFRSNAPEEMQGMMAGASNLMKSAGSTMFAMQLGQALGKLSAEVISGGDIGLPIFQDQRPAFVSQNFVAFVAGLEVEPDQAFIYLGVREMAHARLFKHSKWLREHVVSQIAAYASDISIDNSRIQELSESMDATDAEKIKEALESGALIAERSAEQKLALERIETMLALIEGWVDVVTESATKLLPKSAAIAESVRRRRATGGPAELTFGTLVGLELRPRKLREASAMWRNLGESVGIEKRDSLWNHPDLLPTTEDINDASALIAKLSGAGAEPDDLDRALRDLLSDQ